VSDLLTLFPPDRGLTPYQLGGYKRWCTFALDANVFLGLYTYGDETREDFLGYLEGLQDRIWVPYQAAREYAKNRTSRITEQLELSKEVRNALAAAVGMTEVKKKPRLMDEQRAHPFVSFAEIQARLRNLVRDISHELEAKEQEFQRFLDEDPILPRVNVITRGRIGRGFTQDELEEIYDQGAKRYEREQPPGYMDKKRKPGVEKYGDLVIWHELIRKGRETRRAVWFVTDDTKEDWWDKNFTPPRPRAELVEEMKAKASVQFLMLKSADFYEWAGQHLKRKARAEAIEEARRSTDIEQLPTLAEVLERIGLGLAQTAQWNAMVLEAAEKWRESFLKPLGSAAIRLPLLHASIAQFLSGSVIDELISRLPVFPPQSQSEGDELEHKDEHDEDSEKEPAKEDP